MLDKKVEILQPDIIQAFLSENTTFTMAPTKRNSYTFETKYEAIQKVMSGVKRTEVQKQYGIGSGTISKWLSDSANIIAKVQSGSGKIKKAIPTPFPKTDAAMLKWFTEKNNNDIAIDSRLFKVQAIKFSQELGEKELNGSDGFVSRWKKRHNVVCRTISGEAKSVDLNPWKSLNLPSLTYSRSTHRTTVSTVTRLGYNTV